MTALLVGFSALLGLAIGSFLNVVVWRVPRGESVVSPPRFQPDWPSGTWFTCAADTTPGMPRIVSRSRSISGLSERSAGRSISRRSTPSTRIRPFVTS